MTQRVVLALAVLAIAAIALWPSYPRETRISYDLPPGLRSIQLEYRRDGGVVRSARFGWNEPSPPRLRHALDLSPGSYEVVALSRDMNGRVQRIRRRFEAEPDRVIHIDLRSGERSAIPSGPKTVVCLTWRAGDPTLLSG